MILSNHKNSNKNSPNYKGNNNLMMNSNRSGGSQTNEKSLSNSFINGECYKTPFKNLIEDLNSVSKDNSFLVVKFPSAAAARQMMPKIEAFDSSTACNINNNTNSNSKNSFDETHCLINNNITYINIFGSKCNVRINNDNNNNNNLNDNLGSLLNFEKSNNINSNLSLDKIISEENENNILDINNDNKIKNLKNSNNDNFENSYYFYNSIKKNIKESITINSDFSITDLIDSNANNENILLLKDSISSNKSEISNSNITHNNLATDKRNKNINKNNLNSNINNIINSNSLAYSNSNNDKNNKANNFEIPTINLQLLQSPVKIKNKIIIEEIESKISESLHKDLNPKHSNSNLNLNNISNKANNHISTLNNNLITIQNSNGGGSAAVNDYLTPLKSSSAKKRIFECTGEEFSTVNTTQKKNRIKKRFRKSSEQLKYLMETYLNNKEAWSKELVLETSQKIGLEEKKIYKWFWDQKNKEYTPICFDKKQQGCIFQVRNFEKKSNE